ncbi:MAG: class I SAM-dependent methyltransferase [Thermoanaerobaculia bacterium]
MTTSIYEHAERVAREVAAGRHRELIGGLWEELGRMQLEFAIAEGLRPEMTVVDVGCGCLRGGIHFVRYLQSGNYYGVDAHRELLDAGHGIELAAAGLRDRLPRENLLRSTDFEFSRFGRRFDMAFAQSLFTHLPSHRIQLCLERLAPAIRQGGSFYATFFECPEDRPLAEPIDHQPGGIRTFAAADPYHYRSSDFDFACRGLPWDVRYVGDWHHPRAQRMLHFLRR